MAARLYNASVRAIGSLRRRWLPCCHDCHGNRSLARSTKRERRRVHRSAKREGGQGLSRVLVRLEPPKTPPSGSDAIVKTGISVEDALMRSAAGARLRGRRAARASVRPAPHRQRPRALLRLCGSRNIRSHAPSSSAGAAAWRHWTATAARPSTASASTVSPVRWTRFRCFRSAGRNPCGGRRHRSTTCTASSIG